MFGQLAWLAPVATAGFDLDTDGVFDEQRVLVAWLFGAIIALFALSSALVVRRRTDVLGIRMVALAGVLGVVTAVVIGAMPNDISSTGLDDEARDVLCGPVLNLIRSDPAACAGRMADHRLGMQILVAASFVLLVVARAAAYARYRAEKRLDKSGRSLA